MARWTAIAVVFVGAAALALWWRTRPVPTASPEISRAASAPEAVAPTALAAPLCDTSFAGDDGPALLGYGGEVLKRGLSGSTGTGWTWLSLWATWCQPCLAELPRLSAFARRHAGHGFRLALVSIDDDESAVRQFVRAQADVLAGASEVRWLPPGDPTARGRLLKTLGFELSPRLPAHALIDPRGHVRCVREGVVDEPELAEAARLMKLAVAR